MRKIGMLKIKEWAKDNKGKLLAGAGICVLAGAAAFLGIKLSSNNDDEYGYVTAKWLETASEEELRSVAAKMENELDACDWVTDTDEQAQIYNTHNDVVSAISSRFPLNLPRREHGWYLPNDD